MTGSPRLQCKLGRPAWPRSSPSATTSGRPLGLLRVACECLATLGSKLYGTRVASDDPTASKRAALRGRKCIPPAWGREAGSCAGEIKQASWDSTAVSRLGFGESQYTVRAWEEVQTAVSEASDRRVPLPCSTWSFPPRRGSSPVEPQRPGRLVRRRQAIFRTISPRLGQGLVTTRTCAQKRARISVCKNTQRSRRGPPISRGPFRLTLCAPLPWSSNPPSWLVWVTVRTISTWISWAWRDGRRAR